MYFTSCIPTVVLIDGLILHFANRSEPTSIKDQPINYLGVMNEPKDRYSGVIMGTMAAQITSTTIIYLTV